MARLRRTRRAALEGATQETAPGPDVNLLEHAAHGRGEPEVGRYFPGAHAVQLPLPAAAIHSSSAAGAPASPAS